LEREESYGQLLPHLFRQEYAKMTAVLCRHFGLRNIELAEDIASDTFLKASEHWAIHGVPENPTAWLYTVARNKSKDYLRRMLAFSTRIADQVEGGSDKIEHDFEFSERSIADSQLSMIFAVCNPANSPESQICLALQVLCGFSVEEIAGAFLSTKESIKKRLYRSRVNLREDNFRIRELGENEIGTRLDTVLRTLYLLFNEGYFSRTNNKQIRSELCSEAMRLTLLLVEHPRTNTAKVNALLALMCFQSSRLAARINDRGDPVLFEEQDRQLWDQSLIDRGNYYLVNATSGGEISKYHLEAGIAYWHTTPTDTNKWEHILKLYDQLIRIESSPITALNRVFAFAKVYGHEKAIAEAEQMNLNDNGFYHQLLGYLYSDVEIDKAIDHYQAAIRISKTRHEKQILHERIQRLRKG
jgi:RNA polymerase sigma factor (sigma-70 family)